MRRIEMVGVALALSAAGFGQAVVQEGDLLVATTGAGANEVINLGSGGGGSTSTFLTLNKTCMGIALTGSGRLAIGETFGGGTGSPKLYIVELDGTVVDVFTLATQKNLGGLATFSDGTLAVARPNGHRIEYYTEQGAKIGEVSILDVGAANPIKPHVDENDRLLVVASEFLSGNSIGQVYQFDLQGDYLGLFPFPASQFWEAQDVEGNADGTAWVMAVDPWFGSPTSLSLYGTDGSFLGPDITGTSEYSPGSFTKLPDGTLFHCGTGVDPDTGDTTHQYFIEDPVGFGNVQQSWTEEFSAWRPLYVQFPAVGSSYCQGKVNSDGCEPSISATGTTNLSALAPLMVRATDVVANKNGLLFYGLASAAIPFQGGTLCAAPPLRRTPIQSSGGTAGVPCSGSFALDLKAFGLATSPALTPGTSVYSQYWYRDPADPWQTGLTNALAVTMTM